MVGIREVELWPASVGPTLEQIYAYSAVRLERFIQGTVAFVHLDNGTLLVAIGPKHGNPAALVEERLSHLTLSDRELPTIPDGTGIFKIDNGHRVELHLPAASPPHQDTIKSMLQYAVNAYRAQLPPT